MVQGSAGVLAPERPGYVVGLLLEVDPCGTGSLREVGK